MLNRLWKSGATSWILLLAVMLLLLIDIYGLTLFPRGPIDHERFGTLGNWFQGILTVAVVAIAALALRAERQRQDEESKERKHERQEAERQKVGRVYSWLEPKADPGRGTFLGIAAVLVNQTEVPVYEWAVQVEGHPGLRMASDEYGPLLPGTRRISVNTLELGGNSDVALPRASIKFVAANGEELRRTFLGRLQAESPRESANGID